MKLSCTSFVKFLCCVDCLLPAALITVPFQRVRPALSFVVPHASNRRGQKQRFVQSQSSLPSAFASHVGSVSSRCLLSGSNSHYHKHRCRVTITIRQTITYTRIPLVKMPISFEVLSEQNATTTNAIIDHYSSSADFLTLSKAEGEGILKRDEEDASKLQKGIDVAKEKGVIDPDFVPEDYITIDVLGKNPDQVADEILGHARKSDGGAGGVVVLCGLSGTGKGTTVAKLKEKLEKEDGKQVVCWSNGNIFRSVTLLAATWCEQQGYSSFDAAKALTKENLSSFMGMLEFGKFNGKFDTKISGLGIEAFVSEVQNTDLKVPKVSKNIPTVAEVTQGEVIIFAADAIKKMGDDGIFVLLEGREQTVNYVRTPLRFTLTMSDMTLIGKRRAAQRLAAGTLAEVEEGASTDDIAKALDGQLAAMVKEV